MRRAAIVAVLAAGLSACSDGAPGPRAIHWDRDVGTASGMAISEPRFAAQVYGGPRGTVWLFGDLGAAVAWLDGQPWKDDPATRLWVAGPGASREHVDWLEARSARFVEEGMSPMNYNFAATASGAAGTLSFAEMAARVRAAARTRKGRTTR